ncbi:MAG: nitroreductase family protein [Lachnospiraceae bacterium]|nr:nitroreductase family protein [Lachnospiraceae bacterium]
MEFMELAKKRYSVRKFSDKPVEKDKLEQILEAGNIAPTAKNQQPQRVYVLQSETALSKLKELTHCAYGAGTVLLFTYNEDEEWKNPLEDGVHSGVEDVSIAATHVMLRAAELGLDTCWCNYFANSKLEEAFEIPANEHSVLIMPVGYAAEDAKPTPLHETYKEIETTVKYL